MTYTAALIGCGKMGSAYDQGRHPWPPASHAGALTLHAAFDLVAAADPDTLSLNTCADRWDVPGRYPAADALFADHAPDLAIIATPSPIRLAPIKAALGVGVRAIICEKPLALTVPEAEAIIAACAAADAPLIVNFTRRFDPAAQQAAAWLAAQGPVQAAQGTYVRGIANNGAHLLDLLNWWAGDIQDVVYQRARWPDSPDVVLRLAEGGLAMLNAVSGYDLFRLDVCAVQGALRLDDGGLDIRLYTADAPTSSGITSLLPPQRLPSGLDHALMNLYDHAAEVLAGNAAPLCGPADGLAVTRALAMIEAAG